MNKLSSEENKYPKLERWQGAPIINKVNMDETVLSLKLSLIIHFI